jgi:1,4-alpha-glucan branching enzyme
MVRRRQNAVEFRFRDPQAASVELRGCGGDGSERSWPMRRDESGCWRVRIALGGEEFAFRYLVDERFWAIDGETRGLVLAADGTCRSQLLAA